MDNSSIPMSCNLAILYSQEIRSATFDLIYSALPLASDSASTLKSSEKSRVQCGQVFLEQLLSHSDIFIRSIGALPVCKHPKGSSYFLLRSETSATHSISATCKVSVPRSQRIDYAHEQGSWQAKSALKLLVRIHGRIAQVVALQTIQTISSIAMYLFPFLGGSIFVERDQIRL
jgi:hypothetical protein